MADETDETKVAETPAVVPEHLNEAVVDPSVPDPKTGLRVQPPPYQGGDKALLEADVVDARDRGNIVIAVGGIYFTMGHEALDAADLLRRPATPKKSRLSRLLGQ